MTRNILSILILFISLAVNAQTEMTEDLLIKQSNGSIEFTLKDELLKLNASQIDLFTFKLSAAEEIEQPLPEIIMPTSHAHEYALIDFSKCENGIYWIIGVKGNEEQKFKIFLKK